MVRKKEANQYDFLNMKEVQHLELGGLHALIQVVPKLLMEEIFLSPEAIVGPVVCPQFFGIISYSVVAVLMCISYKLVCE